MAPYEPIPVPRAGCEAQRPGIDGCCYPVPLFNHYDLVEPGGAATFGFVSAIVRFGTRPPPPPPPYPPSPLPRWIPASWAPNYAMNSSISLYWRNGTGLEPAEFYDGYGLIMFDWAHAAQYWINQYSPMDNGAGLAKQCEIAKMRHPEVKCVVYRNTVIALNQFRHISRILDDPAYSGYFLHFKHGATQSGACRGTYDPRGKQSPDHDPIWPEPVVCDTPLPTDVHTPMCDKPDPSKCNRKLYFDQNQCPQVPGDNWSNNSGPVYQGLACLTGKTCNCGVSPCGEYLFDFRNSSAVDWWLHSHMAGATALAHKDVDGLITDDFWRSGHPSEIDTHSIADMGLSTAEVNAIEEGYNAAWERLERYISDNDFFLAGGRNCAYNGDSLSAETVSTCQAKLKHMCQQPPIHGQWYSMRYHYIPAPAYGVAADNAMLDLSFFLLTRGPHAWIGAGTMLGWHMSHWWTANKERRIDFHRDLRPDEFNVDYGIPLGNCTEQSPGVFTRRWTKAKVIVDCNTLKGAITQTKSP